MNEDTIPPWYASTQGPAISLTLKYIVGLLVPVVALVAHVQIGSDIVNNVIDALLIAGFGLGALYAHIRAKQSLQSNIVVLQNQVKALGSRPVV